MEATQISPCQMDRPPSLKHYLSTNDVLLPDDSLALNGYLGQLTAHIEYLDSNIARLQIVDNAKNSERDRLQGEYDLCVKTKSPIRKIPPEILGIIFAFAVNTSSCNRFTDVATLRGVCSSWRQAALSTPGILDELIIYLDKWCPSEIQGLDEWMLHRQFEEELKPWLAIVRRTPAYHLTLALSKLRDPFSNAAENPQAQLARYLLSAIPQPGAITVRSTLGMFGVMLLASSGLTCSARKLTVQGGWKVDLQALGPAFPSLEALEVGIPLSLNTIPPFCHPSLTTLQLSGLSGQGIYLRRLIQELPCLRELKLSSRDYMNTEDVDTTSTAFTHHCLETLFIDGEDFLLFLHHISFPSLRFIELYGHYLTEYDHEMLGSSTGTRIFSTSSADSLLVSIRGDFHRPFLTRLIQSLPPHSNLLVDIDEDDEDGLRAIVPIASDNIEAIFCGRDTVDLSWVSIAEPARKQSSRSLKIYLPTGFGGWEKGYSRQEELRSRGFELEPVANEAAGLMLRSLAPVFSKHSASWWKCEVFQDLDWYIAA
ncbi:hypothetical protein BKA70DRAFT_1341880 [Coprinopsis sp. MPI-PUGE-AT-0042]|nr:hypothetical protein BKA70DRAFT_1341880 [Coprinopsis sp. MPI-PUGE-AT-0042]